MLEKIVATHDIGVVKMEVTRSEEPKDQFLEKIRKLTRKLGIVLIFDECTSGFRQSFGGIHKCFNVEPDIAIFGKAIGNGYALTSIIGRREVMEHAQSTFISSTFWTERIGPVAALKTLEVMGKEKSWEVITRIGKEIQERWKKLAEKYSIKIKVVGIPAISVIIFESEKNLSYKTLITQEMLKSGILASNIIFVCTLHSDNILNLYFEKLDSIFALISKCENEELFINDLLDDGVCDSGFKRLN